MKADPTCSYVNAEHAEHAEKSLGFFSAGSAVSALNVIGSPALQPDLSPANVCNRLKAFTFSDRSMADRLIALFRISIVLS